MRWMSVLRWLPWLRDGASRPPTDLASAGTLRFSRSYPSELWLTPGTADHRLGRRRAIVAAVVAAALAVSVVLVGGLTHGRASASERALDAPAAPSVALGFFAVPGWTATRHVLTVGSMRRPYLVARPARITTTALLPVLVLLHGRGMTPALIAKRSGMLGDRPAIVVLPAGYGRSWNAGACCSVARRNDVDDVTFLSRLVSRVLKEQPDADRHAVYLAGFSNGGRMAYRMACQRPGLFTAVAAVEAVSVYPCSAVGVPVPLLVVASSADPLLRITPQAPPKRTEGYLQPSVGGVVASWRALDGCSAAPATAQVGALTQTRWTGCGGSAMIELDLYDGGRHIWPAGSPDTPAAASQVWAFFRRSAPTA
jgi:polyhydroxybutyrate depolymerase